MDKIRKMDELENYVNQSSIKVSYLFTTIFLIAWSIYDIFSGYNFSLAGILVCINIIIFIGSRILFSKKYDLFKNSALVFIVLGSIFVMVAVILVGFLLSR